MAWCFNVLRVEGPAAPVRQFRTRVRAATERIGRSPLILPLYFGTLVPRPVELDIEESSRGLRGYEAFHGDWERVAAISWIREQGVTDRPSLLALLDRLSPMHRELGDQYAVNLRRHGHRTWHSWNLEYYGTQHDLDHKTDVREIGSTVLEYRFQTLDAHPLPWVEKAAVLFPALHLRLSNAETRLWEPAST